MQLFIEIAPLLSLLGVAFGCGYGLREFIARQVKLSRWPFGGRDSCELYKSIDVRRWRREGRLRAGQQFSWPWTSGGEPSGTINVRTEVDEVVLIYCVRSFLAGWKSIEQRVPITWTHCHLGGRRPWFICSARTQRTILRAAGGRAVSRRRIVRVPKVLRAGLCQPAGRVTVSQHPQGAENQDAARRQTGPLCAVSRQAPPHASADVSAASGAGRGG